MSRGGQRAARVRAPPDAHERGTLHDARTQGVRTEGVRRAGPQLRPRTGPVQGYRRRGRGAHGGDPGDGGRGGRTRRDPRLRRPRARARLRAARPRRFRRAGDRRRAPPDHRAAAGRRAVRAELDEAERHDRPDHAHHRPQHGRQVHLHPPGRDARRDGAGRQLRARRAHAPRRARPRLHAHRRGRRPLAWTLHLPRRNAGVREHPQQCDATVAHRPRRDRARHLHLRRHLDRVERGGIPAREPEDEGEDALRDPLPRADGPRREVPRHPELHGAREAGRRADRLPAPHRPRHREVVARADAREAASPPASPNGASASTSPRWRGCRRRW